MNAPQVLARRATSFDSDAIGLLERECLVPPWTISTIQSVLNDDRYFSVVIVVENDIIGHAIAWNVGDEGEIDRLAISRDWRRRGMGTRLLDALFSMAHNRGVGTFFLEVREDNVAAQQLYLGHGFGVVGERPNYYPDGSAALIMKCDTKLRQ